MSKLKLGPLADDKPVKVSLELPAAVHRNLVAYADYLNRRHVTVTFCAGGTSWRS
jgi:hypothetical protein